MENSLLWAPTARLAKPYGVNRVTRTGHDVHEGKHSFQIKPARGGRRRGLCQPPRRCYALRIHSMISDQSNANIITADISPVDAAEARSDSKSEGEIQATWC
jgi:hypothetical protein